MPAVVFSDPAEVIVAARPEEVLSVLGQMQRAVREGHWVAGLVSYEAPSGLDPALTVRGAHQLSIRYKKGSREHSVLGNPSK